MENESDYLNHLKSKVFHCKILHEKRTNNRVNKVYIIIADTYPDIYIKVYDVLNILYNRDNNCPSIIGVINEFRQNSLLSVSDHKSRNRIIGLVKHFHADWDLRDINALSLDLPFNEYEVIISNLDLLYGLFNTEIELYIVKQDDDKNIPQSAKRSASSSLPGKPGVFFE